MPERVVAVRVPEGLFEMFSILKTTTELKEMESVVGCAVAVFMVVAAGYELTGEVGMMSMVDGEFEKLELSTLGLHDQSEEDQVYIVSFCSGEADIEQMVSLSMRYLKISNFEEFVAKALAYIAWVFSHKREAWEPVAYARSLSQAYILPLMAFGSFFSE